MSNKLKSIAVFAINYFMILTSGFYRIYKGLFLNMWKHFRNFSIREFIFYVLAFLLVVFSGLGWRGYKITIYDEIVYHTISNDDFLIFLFGALLVFIPAIWKFIRRAHNKTVWVAFNNAGLGLNTLFFVINFFKPSRISAMPDASFTLWFYLYGANLLILWILSFQITGIPGIFMPSIHSRTERL
ncbi:MAG: hypothetical protein OEV66_11340 [Spirochaetia bacterium]|nr:hypothetical protein [Spirochaetia bacterium]